LVLVVVGIVWSLVFLVLLFITLATAYFIRKYLGMAHQFLSRRVPVGIAEVQLYADAVRYKTAELPGSGSRLPPGQRMPHIEIALPFLRRRRPWWQRMLGR
jgi:hypothetical protein